MLNDQFSNFDEIAKCLIWLSKHVLTCNQHIQNVRNSYLVLIKELEFKGNTDILEIKSLFLLQSCIIRNNAACIRWYTANQLVLVILLCSL